MFMANEPEGAGWFYSDLNHYKMNVIKYIDESAKRTHDLGDVECFKRKVMELNPVIFNVLNDLMYYSQLFWDAENEEFKYPEIEESQENYNNQNLIS
jgi:hypothetical protein